MKGWMQFVHLSAYWLRCASFTVFKALVAIKYNILHQWIHSEEDFFSLQIIINTVW